MLLIPVMYLRGGMVLKPAGSGGPSVKTDPLELARDWFNAGCELIHIVDLDVPASGHSPNCDLLARMSGELKLGFQIEANIRSVDTAQSYFGAGAVRLLLGSIAYQKPVFLAELCRAFPGKIATQIDVRRGKVQIKGYAVAANKTALDYVEQFKEAGVTTVFYSDSEEEGVLKPADFGRIREFLRKALIKTIHTTDVATGYDIEKLIMLESYGLLGTMLCRSLYEGRVNLESAITLVKEKSEGHFDEPTYTDR